MQKTQGGQIAGFRNIGCGRQSCWFYPHEENCVRSGGKRRQKREKRSSVADQLLDPVLGQQQTATRGLAEGADGGLSSPSEAHTDVGTLVVQKHIVILWSLRVCILTGSHVRLMMVLSASWIALLSSKGLSCFLRGICFVCVCGGGVAWLLF